MADDPLIVYDHHRQPTISLRGLLAGRPSFLVGGGPSAKRLDMTQLQRRGVFSMGVNNVAGEYPVSSFVCSDPPSKFHDGIWRDPCIMKFLPIPKLTERGKGQLRTRIEGRLQPAPFDGRILSTIDCPNVWGFARRSWWAYDETFFTEDHAAWGNGKEGLLRTKNPRVLNTTLLALRLLYYLGSRRVFLVGVDFYMDSTGYSFDQGRTSKAVENNNSQYRVVNDGLCQMVQRGIFQNAGLEVYNCNQTSGLRAFQYVPFETAIKDTLKDFPDVPFDLHGWYEKGPSNG